MHNFSTDQPRRHYRYIVIGIAATGILLVSQQYFGIAGGVSAGVIATIIYYIFTHWIWKSELLHDLGVISVPNLNGTWRGHLYTSAPREVIEDELVVEVGEQIDGLTKIETEIHIDQTWDKIQVSMDGPQSPSYSRGATLLVREKAWPTITYNYLNEGSTTDSRLDMHYGTTTLQYVEEEDKLEGPYYTRPDQRGNHGILELYRR